MDNREEAIFAVLQGVPVEVIAKELDVSENTVYRWLREGGHTKQVRSLRDKAIIDDYLSGERVHDIVSKHDICVATLYVILHSNKVELRAPNRDVATDEEIVHMYKSGMPVIAIRKESGRSFGTIYSILEDHNVRLRQYSQRRGE